VAGWMLKKRKVKIFHCTDFADMATYPQNQQLLPIE
jgi:hypothetical protein